MSKERDLLQSVLSGLTQIQNASDEALAAEGVEEMLKDTDDTVWEIVETIEEQA